MGWTITLAVLFLLAILPLGIHIRYNEGGAMGKLILGPMKILLFPRPPKEKKEKKEKEPSAKSGPPKETNSGKKAGNPSKTSEPEKKEKGGPVTDFLPLVQVGLNLLNDFRRKLRVDCLELKVIMAGGDPCDLAVNYGRAWAAVGNLLPRLERVLIIKKRDIQIECDFTADSTLVTARLDLTITLGRLFAMVAVNGFRALKEFLKIKKKRKGGAAS